MKACLQLQPEFCSREKLLYYFKRQQNGKPTQDSIKFDRWFLELQDRNIKVEYVPGSKDKAADCLSILPYITWKNDNPLHAIDFSSVSEKGGDTYIKQASCGHECRLC